MALASGEWLDKETPLYFVVGAPPLLGHNNQQRHLKAKTGFCTLELTKTVKSYVLTRNFTYHLVPNLRRGKENEQRYIICKICVGLDKISGSFAKKGFAIKIIIK